MMFIRLFLYEHGVHYLKLKIFFSSYTYIFPHKIYRRKTKPAYMMFRAYALFHHIIFFILEALRHWLNGEEHVLLPHNKISLLLLEYIFVVQCGSNVVHEFLMKGTISAYYKIQMSILFVPSVTKWWSINIITILTLYMFLWFWKENEILFRLILFFIITILL